jgi:subtilisin family serine protease
MGKKYMIVVEAPYLAAGAGMRSATRLAEPLSTISHVYEDRRSALVSIAQALLPSRTTSFAHASDFALHVLTDLPTAIASTVTGAPVAAAAVHGIQVLEAIGALIIDDSQVDPNQLAGVIGLQVFEDFDIELPQPVASSLVGAAVPWHLRHIATHGVVPQTGTDIVVGVLDTGIDASHPEFAGKAIHFAEFNAAGMQVSTTPRDAGTHGTHVCSLIAGATCGVATDARLAVAAVLTTPTAAGSFSGSLVQIANGLNWLLTQTYPGRQHQGVDIINASLGGSGYNAFLRAALASALLLPGVLMVAAIGNSGRTGIGRHGSPGNYPEALGVGAVDAASTVADFSDWGVSPVSPPTPVAVSKPDLSAPGVDVLGALPGGAFGLKSGTSMASPLVCGLGARMLSANPALLGNPAQLRADLLARATLNPVNPNPLGGNLGGVGEI